MITTEQHLAVLTAEVLRDLGRNEAAGWAVRKAAVKMLIERNHPFSNHPDFRELRLELKEESEAHAEVESLIGQVEETVVQKLDDGVLRCKITGHPCGTDTVVENRPCKCENCKSLENPGPFKASFTTRDM